MRATLNERNATITFGTMPNAGLTKSEGMCTYIRATWNGMSLRICSDYSETTWRGDKITSLPDDVVRDLRNAIQMYKDQKKL